MSAAAPAETLMTDEYDGDTGVHDVAQQIHDVIKAVLVNKHCDGIVPE